MGRPKKEVTFLPEQEQQALWDRLLENEGKVFYTATKLAFTYHIDGYELFVDRKDKSVTYSSIMMAYHEAKKEQAEFGCVKGPKRLKTFGASYLYPVFLSLGICTRLPETDQLSFLERNGVEEDRRPASEQENS